MGECERVDVRDLLPELLDDDGSRRELAPARDHAAACDACRAELALLREVRAAARVPRIDLERIAAAVPGYRPAPVWRRAARAPLMRMAAAVVLMAGLGSLLVPDSPDPALRDTVASHASVPATSEFGIGTPFGDLSESDLRDLLRELGDYEAVTPADADVIVLPAVGSGA